MVKKDKRFKLRKLPSDRHYLVEENIALVYDFMKLYLRRYPDSDRQEVESAGMLSLVKAAAGYNQSAGFKFSTYFHSAAWRECSRLLQYNRDCKDEALTYVSDRKATQPKVKEEDSEILDHLLASLTDKERHVVIEAIINEKQYVDLSKELNTTRQSISDAVRRAIRKMQVALKELQEREYQLS